MKTRSILELALEADDITKEVSAQLKASDEPDDNEEPDMEKTDDIFGTKAHAEKKEASTGEDSPSDDTEGESQPEGDEETPPEDDSEETPTDEESEGEPTDDAEGEDAPADDSTESTDSESPVDDIATAEQRQNLKENMITLLGMYKNQLNTLNNINFTDNTDDNRVFLYKIKDNISTAIEILTKKIVEEFPEKSYVSLMKTYIMMKQLMDINIDMIDKFISVANDRKSTTKESK